MNWQPNTLLKNPIFAPLYALISVLPNDKFPTLIELNAVLAERSAATTALCVAAGHALRFVPQQAGKLGFEAQYEPRCYLTGEVQTRENNWHDLLNALVWLTFPRTKAAINARHFAVLQTEQVAGKSQRGAIRDSNTLLDESGVIVACANPELAALLRNFQWHELFWQQRAAVQNELGFYVFGHGLYEKAMQPYIGITGQGIIIDVAREFFSWDAVAQHAHLDEQLACHWRDPAQGLSTRAFCPVPLLGVPSWWADNCVEDFYANTAYFRAGRRA